MLNNTNPKEHIDFMSSQALTHNTVRIIEIRTDIERIKNRPIRRYPQTPNRKRIASTHPTDKAIVCPKGFLVIYDNINAIE